jgi:hypothetical protein
VEFRLSQELVEADPKQLRSKSAVVRSTASPTICPYV